MLIRSGIHPKSDLVRGKLLLLLGLMAIVLALAADRLTATTGSGFGSRQFVILATGCMLVVWGTVLASPLTKLESIMVTTPGAIARWINTLGLTIAVCLVLYTLLSYGLGPFVIGEVSPESRKEFLAAITGTMSFLGERAQAFANGESELANRPIWLAVYLVPTIIASTAFLALLTFLARHRNLVDRDSSRLILRWTGIFAVASLLANPVLVRDLWFSVVWGRLIQSGLNPYYVKSTAAILKDVPLLDPQLMNYGPLWAVVIGSVATLTGGDLVGTAVLLKLVIASAWIGSIYLIWSLLQRESPWKQSVAIAIAGWMPVSVMQSVAEGHNDIVMIFFVLLWLNNLQKGNRYLASLSLAASVLFKYVTAPLFLLDFLFLLRSAGQPARNYLPRALTAIGLVMGGIALFYRSPAFFDPLLANMGWRFYTISDFLRSAGMMMGLDISGFARAGKLVFLLLGLVSIIQYARMPTITNFWGAVLGLLTAVLFGYGNWFFPWYILWLLPVAALVASSVLGRWATGVGLAAPFLLLPWVVFPEMPTFLIFEVTTLIFYIFVIQWVTFVPVHWLGVSSLSNRTASYQNYTIEVRT